MKKITAVILSFVMLLALCVPAFAASGVAAKDIIMGDLDSNKKITASDARLALRAASKLDVNNYDVNAYDTDGNGKLTAADARTILRVAAKLQNFDIGFDANGVPNAVSAFSRNAYSVDASMKSEGVSMDLNMIVSGENIYMGIGDMLNLGKISGVLIVDKKFYAVDLAGKSAIAVPDNMLNNMGEDMDISGMMAQMSKLFVVDFDEISETKTDDGKDALRYSKTTDDGFYSAYYVDYMGRLLSFEGGTINADKTQITVDTTITFKSFSGNVDSSIFDISSYVVM